MKSKKVWVIDIDTKKTISAMIGIVCVIVRLEVRIVAIRFMWMPGKRPVRVPAASPIIRARVNSNNIWAYRGLSNNILL